MLIPSYTFEQFKATREKHINPTLSDNVLLPENFVEHFYHNGSSHELHSIIQSGSIRGGKDVKKGKHAVFCTAVNPMFIGNYREQDYNMTQPRIAVYKHDWKEHLNTVYWCNLRVAQSEGVQFYQTRSNAITLYKTLPAICIEKVVIRKTREELHSKTYQSPIAPKRVVLKPNLNCERQDTTSSDARTSFGHSDEDGGMYKKTCRGEIDFRIQGLPHSADEEHDHFRKQAIQKLIHQFENHTNKEALQEDLQQKSAFNRSARSRAI